MIEACPNLNDPNVAREFNEIKNATSEKTAYNIWSLNNGYGIDKAPNGEPSVLFQSLLASANGDRVKAIQMKAKVYGDKFRKWFGDWIESNDVSYVDQKIQQLTKMVQKPNSIELQWKTAEELHNDYLNEQNSYLKDQLFKIYRLAMELGEYDFQKLQGKSYAIEQGLEREYTENEQYTQKQYTKNNVSKVVDENGEPLIVYHGTVSTFNAFKTNQQHIEEEETPFGTIPHFSETRGSFFTTDKKYAQIYGSIVMPCFLNIKQMYGSFEEPITNLHSNVSTDIFNFSELENDDIDGIIGRDVDVFTHHEYSNGSHTWSEGFEFVIKNPNQVKSAVDNNGEYSVTDDNIYHNKTKDLFNVIKDIKWTEVLNQITNEEDTHNLIYKEGGNYYITLGRFFKGLPQLINVIKAHITNQLIANNINPDAFIIAATNDNRIKITKNDKISKNERKLISTKSIETTLSFLESKIPGLRHVVIRQNSPLFRKLNVDQNANAFFKDGVVYLVEGRFNEDIAIEECLHPLVNATALQNKDLFAQLVNTAKSEFPALYEEIKQSYDSESIDKELVTQALSRYTRVESKSEDKEKTTWQKLVDLFYKYVTDLFGGIQIQNIKPTTTFKELSNIILSENGVFDIDLEGLEYNIISTDEYESAAIDALIQSPVIQSGLSMQRKNYVDSFNPTTADDVIRLSMQFDLEEMRKNTDKLVQTIAGEFDLSRDPSGNFVSLQKSKQNIVLLLNNIDKRLRDPKFAPVEAQFLCDTLLGTDDISTILMQMSKIYIEDFYESDAMQALMRIIDPKGTMHKDDIIEEITRLLTKAIINPKSVESSTLQKFNDGITNFFRKRYNQNTISSKAKAQLIQTIASNMACCEDLQNSNTEDLLHDISKYIITGKETKVTPKEIISAIKTSVKVKIKALRSINNPDETKVLVLNQLLAKLEDVDLDNNPDDVLGVVSDFISDGMQEINKANSELFQMQNGNIDEIDSNRLYQIKTDIVGYYRSIISNYIIPFTRETDNPTLKQGGALYSVIMNILDKVGRTQKLYDHVLQLHVENIIDKWVDANVNIGDKERFKINCKLWLHNKINKGDLGFFENWTKSAVSSHSPIVRMIDDFVRQSDTEIRQKSLERSLKLQQKYKKAESLLSKMSPFNYQRQFCELDSDGQTTGNFISEVNVGQFEKDKKKFISDWISKNGGVLNEDGNLEFHDEQTWKNYNDAYDDFLAGRQHRRYTAEYYKLQRKYMSKDTIEYKNNIRSRIQLLYDKCFDTDIQAPNTWKLNRSDFNELQELLLIQQNLSNPYIVTYDSNGKISNIQEKVGDQLRMAKEIAAFNEAVRGGIKFSPNFDKYNETKEAIKNKFGENSNEYKHFVYNFSTRQVKPEYYQKMQEIFGNSKKQKIDQLVDIDNRIRAIVNSTLTKRGKYQPDISKLSDSAFAELKRLEQMKLDILSGIPKEKGKKITEEQAALLNSMHRYVYAINPATGIPYINELKDEYESSGRQQEFQDKFFIKTDDIFVPLSVFTWNDVSSQYIENETPIGMFSDIDESSQFVDPLYDPNDKEFMNIDKTVYHNSKFDDIKNNPKMMSFYKEMIDMMEEAWEMIPNINRHYKYMLPQRRGSISQLAARDAINTLTLRQGRDKSGVKQIVKNTIKLIVAGTIGGAMLGGLASLSPWLSLSTALFTGSIYGSATGLITGLFTRDKNISDQIFNITENDTEFNETYSIRPDGTEVETIPIRFVKRLDDPTSVSTSLIHSISTFYEMALNYKTKEELAPIIENVQFELNGGFNGQFMSDQAERIRSYKSAMVYGRRKTGLARRSSNKMTQSEQQISKLVSYILNVTHSKMLPGNGTSIYKNFIDSTCSFMSLISSAKQMTVSDLFGGIVDMGKELVNGTAFTNIGSPTTNSFIGQAMQMCGVHEGISNTFEDTEKYWLRRVIQRFYSMGPFTLIDYTFKGLYTAMVFNTYRLILNPSTGKHEFMNKEEAQFAYSEFGGRKKGKDVWKKAKVRLKDAYVTSPTGLKLKSEYLDTVRPDLGNGKKSFKLENRVSGLVKEQSAVVNGMLDSQDINKISQNFIGSMILLMRGWMVSQLIDYNKDGQDFSVFATNPEDIQNKLFKNKTLGSFKSKIVGSVDSYVIQGAPSEFEGQYNFATGFVEKGWWTGWVNTVKNVCKFNKLSKHSKYQLKYLAMILATTVSLGLSTFPLYNWRDASDIKYKDSDQYNIERVMSNFLYTGTVAAYSERFGQLGPIGFMNSFLELINSPTVASSYVKDLGTVIDALQDGIVMLEDIINNKDVKQSEPMQIVNRGSFKGRTKLEKDILKASTEIPGINTVGVTNMYKTVSPDAQKEKLKFYRETIPVPEIQPWLKLPEKNSTNKQSTTSSSKKKKHINI